MRTTLILDDQLFRRAKREAGEKGTTLSKLVNTAVRNYFFSSKPLNKRETTFSMPVFGEFSNVHQTPEQLSTLRDEGR